LLYIYCATCLDGCKQRLPVYSFPLDARNIIGTLGFQLFLSGPAEEVVFRALPVILLAHSFGGSIKIKGSVTLEVLLASVLFAFAHMKWSLFPVRFEIDTFQIIYAFVLGTIQGIVYQKSKSILYPLLMHSFSNVLMVGGGYLVTAFFT
jgi:membrane protease YdiL (CAAX protease family)